MSTDQTPPPEEKDATKQEPSGDRVSRLVRLLRNWKFTAKSHAGTFKCTLMAGEIGEYFAHSNTYLFRPRRGWVPYIPAKKLMANPREWECLENARAVTPGATETP